MLKTEGWSDEVRDTGSEPQRRFVLSYRPVITQIAYQIASGLPPAIELGDLISDGTIGLIKAIGTYDPQRRVQFSSYAEGRIRGAILDGLRRLDWMPRSLRRDLRRMERARVDVQQRQGRPATTEELAGEMELTLGDLYAFLSIAAPAAPSPLQSGWPTAHAHNVPSPDDLPAPGGQDPQTDFMKRESCALLRRAIDGLPAKERVVISSYYLGDLNLREIGQHLGLSESRICQIHGRAMKRIRRILARLMTRPATARPRADNRRQQEAS